MKKLILILSVLAVGLTGCYVVPHRDRDDGYRDGRDRHHDDDRSRDQRHDPGRDGYR
jgi:hypothetical protein